MKWPIPAHQRLLDDALLAVAGKKIRRLIVAMPPQHGKQLANSELVATASGWKRHGDLVVGDEVFGVDGGLVRVLWVSAESADKVLVTFTDGGTLKVHPNHEWTVYDRARAAWRTVETKYLQGQSLWAGGRARFQLPAIACLQYPARDLAVDPYTLGAWLGDGATTTGVFCGAAEDFEWIVHRSACAHGSIWVHAGTGVRYCTFLGIRRGLRQIGVLGHKHIPAEYQISSEAQRRALLAGLVDTDGNVLPTGQVRFITCSRELADGVVQLVRGLGYRTKLVERKRVDRHRTIRDVQPVYEVGWTPHDGLGQGTLPRKVIPRFRPMRRVGIAAIAACDPEPGRCIQVDSPDGLYLVGETLLPTHNSTAISACFPAWYLATYPDERLLLASYASHFASWWGGQARDMFEAWAPTMTGAQLDPNMGAASWWGVKDHRGYMATAGAGGSFIGRPASGVIIDDPHAGAMEAKSDLVRQRIWEWYISVLHGRLTPDGFIVIVMCMTGDTPVLRPDGSTTPLSQIRPGDSVATYENGRIGSSTVDRWASQGHDTVYEIRMKSGANVRANARHPFLTLDQEGNETWRRTADLMPGDHILRATKESGSAWCAPQRIATSPRGARECARHTTISTAGLRVFGRLLAILRRGALRGSKTATGSPQRSTTEWRSHRVEGALFANGNPSRPAAGAFPSVSTTTTKPEESEPYSATTATLPSDICTRQNACAPPLSTWSVTPDQVLEVVEAGTEEVFDLQVGRTENFIANGLVSHNSRWHEDDLVGRLLTQAQKGGEQWTVLHLPAMAITQVKGPDGTMRQVKDALGRPEGAALWPERGYDEAWMQETRRTLGSYYWSAQYQGQPSPDSGGLYVRSGLRTFQSMVGSKESELVPWIDPGPGETKTWSAYKLKMLQGDPEIVPDRQVVRFSTVDTAFGLGDQNDYTVIAIWGILPGNRLALLHIDRERREGEDIATEIVNLLMDWKCQWVEVESVEWLIQMIKRKGWRAIKPLKPQGDKTTRAQPSIIMWNNGDCYIPSNATWGDDFVEELAQFDKGAHDDQVDVFAYAALSVTALANRNRTIPLPLAIGPRTSPWQ